MNISEIDIDALEALADAATQGPWSANESAGTGDRFISGADGTYITDMPDPDGPEDDANWQFIAAANPATVKQLIARLRSSEGTK